MNKRQLRKREVKWYKKHGTVYNPKGYVIPLPDEEWVTPPFTNDEVQKKPFMNDEREVIKNG